MFSTLSAYAGGLEIGGKAPVRIQTMYDRAYTMDDAGCIVSEINSLASIGCDIIRFSFSSKDDAAPFSEIARRSPIPVVADIHFDYRLAVLALESGAAKIRINPGNIGAEWKTREVVAAARDSGAAIRIGLNSGSLPKDMKGSVPDIMVESALRYIDLFESMDFRNTGIPLPVSAAHRRDRGRKPGNLRRALHAGAFEDTLRRRRGYHQDIHERQPGG